VETINRTDRNKENAMTGGKHLQAIVAAAANGPLLQAELIPLSNQGKLRITYNWLYSSLNCDPNDSSSFAWTLNKLDNTHVSLSPTAGYAGKTLYASVRPDLNWFVQVQAPNSADWITGVGGDEIIEMDSQGELIVAFKGLNGQHIAINSQMSDHGGHSGYRLQSVGASDPKTYMWFMGVTRILQAGLQIPLRSAVTDADIRQAYEACGLTPSDDDIAQMKKKIS
jgi:hypothetical protein